MKNSEIKRAIKESRIMQYEIAAQMGISEYTLCKWFRKELTAEQQSPPNMTAFLKLQTMGTTLPCVD